MNKEPIGLYIFRFVLGIGLFAFMCMLYWSSLLIEQDMKQLHNDFKKLRSEVLSLESQPHRQNPISYQTLPPSPRPHIDPSLPNLLEEDPFYTQTLPKLLGPDFKPKGTFQSSSLGKYENLHPFSQWAEVSGWVDQCGVAVAKSTFGKYETMSPDMAIKLEARKMKNSSASEFWVHLREDVFWQPLQPDYFSEKIELAPQFLKKHQVTSEDFKFYFDAIMNPYVQEMGAVALRTYFGDIQEIEIVDSLTFIVRWKTSATTEADGQQVQKVKYIAKIWTGALHPLPSFVFKYFSDGKKIIEDDSDPETYRTNSVWAQNFSQHWAKNIIISCGGWIFDGKTDRQIKFRRNPDYYFPYAVLAEKMEIRFKNTPESAWQDFKTNQLDSYILQPNQVIELETFLQSDTYHSQSEKHLEIKRLDYVARRYSYIGWNEAKEFFKSKKVRQALTMAIDRRRIIQQNLNGLGIEITGTFFPFSSSYDPSITPWPFDLQRARILLEEEGWFDSDGDGIIDKMIKGKRTPFQFNLTYYVMNPLSKSICEYIATALKEVGILCNLNGIDVADLSAALDDKSFDAICLAWSYGTPPENPRQLWYSSGAKEKGSSNAIGFANPEIDKIIDALDYEYDSEKRTALYHSFDKIIHEEAPYTFLFTPKAVFIYREYLQNVFIPAERQDLIPGANVAEPDPSIFWLKKHD